MNALTRRKREIVRLRRWGIVVQPPEPTWIDWAMYSLELNRRMQKMAEEARTVHRHLVGFMDKVIYCHPDNVDELRLIVSGLGYPESVIMPSGFADPGSVYVFSEGLKFEVPAGTVYVAAQANRFCPNMNLIDTMGMLSRLMVSSL